MPLRFSFAGFGHGHIYSLHEKVVARDDLDFADAFEDMAVHREEAEKRGLAVAFERMEDMLSDSACDVVAIGADFTRRGPLAIAALEAGKHVIADKPLCTSLDDLEAIERLAKEKGLKVGCMLGQRDSPVTRGLRERLQAGRIGDVHAIAFGGQHPLLLDTRARWYFEPGKHGGTITDIFIHAADAIPWATGLAWETVKAARCWNALAKPFPHFEDGAQLMMTMSNGCGVMGDVSYHMPDEGGYAMPYYWRMTLFGEKGVMEATPTQKTIAVTEGGKVVVEEPAPKGSYVNYLDAFLADIAGDTKPDVLDTADVLKAMRVAILTQQAADEGRHDVRLR